MEALKRLRTGGQQNVRAEHLMVNKGGQALRRGRDAGVVIKSDTNPFAQVSQTDVLTLCSAIRWQRCRGAIAFSTRT